MNPNLPIRPDLKDHSPTLAERTVPANLLAHAKPEDRAKPKGYYKAIFFNALSVFLAAGIGLTYSMYLKSILSVWFVVGAVTLFATVAVIQTMVTPRFSRRAFLVVLQTIAMTGFFWTMPFYLLCATAGIVLVFLLWGDASCRHETENGLELRFFHAARGQINKIITAVVFMTILFYLPRLQDNKVLLTETTFAKFYDIGASFIGRFYPEVKTDGSLVDLAKSIVRLKEEETLKKITVPDAMREGLITAAAAEAIRAAGDSLGLKNLQPTDKLSTTVYNYITLHFNQMFSVYGMYFIIAWGISLFFAVRSLGFILSFFVAFFAFMMYLILEGSDFLQIKEEAATRETVNFS